jgi:three-Cys-motif partner protein
MSDNLPTVWEGSAHTFAKHQILDTYLKAWMPIMSRQSHRLGISETELIFIDGFAGPGRYTGGEDGSPILAIESVLNHSHDFHIPIIFLFIEQDRKRCAILQDVVRQHKKRTDESLRIKSVKVEEGDCEIVLNKFLENFEKANRNVGPAFFFLDQFGFSNVSMRLIQRIMSQPLCEVFSYLNWDHMNRFLVDKTKWTSISKAFGGDEWRQDLTLEPNKRAVFMLDTYNIALKEKAHSKYVWHFAMCDRNDKLLYWLLFCTNNLRGLEEMKKAMMKVGSAGGFRFSDKDNPSQLNLFANYKQTMLADDLISNLYGKTLTVFQVKEFVLTETPTYLYKNALKHLEKQGKLKVVDPPPKRRKGTFAVDQMQLEFLSDTLEET